MARSEITDTQSHSFKKKSLRNGRGRRERGVEKLNKML